jgi:hypothetical protein
MDEAQIRAAKANDAESIVQLPEKGLTQEMCDSAVAWIERVLAQ